jgi:hypothetical protein
MQELKTGFEIISIYNTLNTELVALESSFFSNAYRKKSDMLAKNIKLIYKYTTYDK